MIGILKGLATTMKHALDGNTITVEYPKDAPDVEDRFRGVHKWSEQRCIWCRQCEKVCPNDTIQIVMDEDRNGEQYNLHIGQCIYCRLCEEVCPTEAIVLTENFEFVGDTKDDLAYAKEELKNVPWYEKTDPVAAREPDREAWVGEGDGEIDYQ
ncbi:NuoI/complex I 23 kDa subunit family protein [Halococcoides cellulosivorans]|uniref:(4Fe-4S)-binding protein n=1 Tax=Halococcoides cellulosivorans TaxID=1679096 RepID=A0A2R4WZY1_9EURY|nr:NADH-quinone oxidoreductase subunit I [Halococcoides cellulosivorans]AWB27104.1 (4Fe-4S)-binding protein [Halococcoides cellulosivorans]